MDIKCYKDHNGETGKLTTYKIKINDEILFLDFGSYDMLKSDIKGVKYIFVTHEHQDHFKTLYYLAQYIPKDVKIFMTKTTKSFIELSFKMIAIEERESNLLNKKTAIFNQIEIVYFNQQKVLYNNKEKYLKFSIYPSGHTYGSVMYFIESNEFNILYTGDMGYSKRDIDRQYTFDFTKRVDYLLIDGTNVLNEHKGDNINNIAKRNAKYKRTDLLVKPDKAVGIAQQLSKNHHLINHKIIYRRDLIKYLEVLYSDYYNIFKDDKILMELDENMPTYKKAIYLTSVPSKGYKKPFHYSLHINLDDIFDFVTSFLVPPKVLITHYNMEKTKEMIEVAKQYNYFILTEGENKVWDKTTQL